MSGGNSNICIEYIEDGGDPSLHELLTREGYEVLRVPSTAKALSFRNPESCSLVALSLSRDTRLQADEFLKEAAGRLASAKFMVVLPNGAGEPGTRPKVDPAYAGRVLWIWGETTSEDNEEAVRQFLAAEGYQWASELGPGAQASGAADTFGEEPKDETRVFRKFVNGLAAHTDLRSMLDEALRKYLEITQCDAGSLYLWDEDAQRLVLEAAHGPEKDARVGLRQKLGEGLAGWVAEVRESILVTDSRKVQKLKRSACRRYSTFSCIAAPLIDHEQLIGVVCLTMPKNQRTLTAIDLHMVQGLSRRLASMIPPVSALSELRRFSEKLHGALKSTSDLALEKDSQVAALRALSSNVLESVPLAVIAYDPELRVRTLNRMARKFFGMEAADTAGPEGPPLENGIELDPSVWRSKLRSIVETGRSFRLQRVGYGSGDRKLTLDIRCSPLVDSEGSAMGGILVVQDMTKDVEMEERLSSAERLALMGRISAKVAHELSNPLDGILRFVNLALRQLHEPEQARAYLEESRHGLIRMNQILGELLTYSRGRRPADQPATVSQAILQSVFSYEQRAREANIEIQLDVPPDLPACPGADLWEVVGNVVKNALDAMVENGVLTISARSDGDQVTILISDTGPGIPEELREKIFEPFFTTKKSGNGTGLGLALCRDSLHRIGGQIRLRPSERGTTFEITLPIKQSVE